MTSNRQLVKNGELIGGNSIRFDQLSADIRYIQRVTQSMFEIERIRGRKRQHSLAYLSWNPTVD